jgi:hypothetical protein
LVLVRRDLPVEGKSTDGTMTLEIGNRGVATTRFSEHAAVDGDGVLSTRWARLFSRSQSITPSTPPNVVLSATATAIVRDGVA